MCGNFTIVVLVVLVSGMCINPAMAWSYGKCDQAYRAHWPLVGFRDADRAHKWSKPCRNDKCRASRDLQCVVDAMDRRNFPNTMAFPSLKESDVARNAYFKRIDAFGTEHPDRIPAYCTMLVHYARQATGNVERNGNLVGDVTELAVRLDRPEASCSTQVMVSFPRTPAVARSIDEAREYCWAAKNLCDRIRLPDPATPGGNNQR